MADPNLGEIAATVWDNKIGGKPTDNIFTSRALFYLLGEKGFKESADGGKTFEFSLNYAENTTFKSYGEFDQLDTTRINVFDAAQYTVKIHAGTLTYSELEKLRAAGASGKFDLIAEKLNVAKESHVANINRVLFGDGTGNGSLDADGLQKIIATAPTSGTVGGINRASFSFWRNQQGTGTKSSTAFDNLRSTMRTVYNKCSRGGTQDTPTAWITDRPTFEGYESLLVANERYNKDGKGQRGGDAGFDNDALMFKGAKGLYDEDAVAGNLYFMNPDYLKLVYLKGGWMKMYPEVDPANQLANVHKVASFFQLCTNNSRRLGVVTAIS